MPNHLLHPELIDKLPLTSGLVQNRLSRWVEGTAALASTEEDVPVSVLIRSRNNVSQIEGLFEDIRDQVGGHEPEIIVVDTESSDGTVDVARRMGATVLTMTQDDFTYPKSMNLGFEAASNEWVLTLVDHSALSHRHILDIARHWNSREYVGGIAGTFYPSASGSRSERLAAGLYAPWYLQEVKWDKPELLANNCSFVRRSVWQELGGFDDGYAAGGEDNALAREMLRSGYHIVVDPALVVHHSHGLGPINSLRQFRYWQTLSKPLAFDEERLSRYRPDLTA